MELMKNLGHLIRFFDPFLKELERLGGSEQDFDSLSTKEREDIIKKLARIVIQENSKDRCWRKLEKDKKRSALQIMCDMKERFYIDPNIERFVHENISCKYIPKEDTTNIVEMKLWLWFDFPPTTTNILLKARGLGLKTLIIRDALKLREQWPDQKSGEENIVVILHDSCLAPIFLGKNELSPPYITTNESFWESEKRFNLAISCLFRLS